MVFEVNLLSAAPYIVGLFVVAVAVLERGYKTFLEKKAQEPELEFNSTYLLNFWVSASVGVVVATLVPTLIGTIANTVDTGVTLASIVITAAISYLAAYTALDKLNTGTEKALEIQDLLEPPSS